MELWVLWLLVMEPSALYKDAVKSWSAAKCPSFDQSLNITGVEAMQRVWVVYSVMERKVEEKGLVA